MKTSSPSLMRSSRFAPIFWTQFFGALNDNVLKNALIILIEFRAADVLGLKPAQMVSLAGGIFILPFFLFSATAGQLADAVDKAKLMRIVKWCEVGIMALASAGLFLGQIEFLLACLFLMGLHSTFFGPVKYSILPQILNESQLVAGNAFVESGTFLAILIGTIAGGQLISLPGYGPAATSAALLAIALAGLVASYRVPSTKVGARGLRVDWNPIPPTVETLRSIAGQKTILNAVLGISWFWFFGGAMLSLFPAYCKDVLGATESGVTLFLATFSLGIGAGSLLCAKLSHKRIELGLVPFGSFGMSLFALDLWLSPLPPVHSPAYTALGLLAEPTSWRILFDLFALSCFSGMFIVPLYALLQDRTDVGRRSRVIAANNVVNALFMVVAALFIAGVLAAGLTIPEIFAILGLMNAAVAIYIYTIVPEFFLRFVAWILARLIYSLRVIGIDHVPAHGACVLVCNHVSFVDWLIIFAAIRRPVRFVMDRRFAKGWIGHFMMKRGKVIPIASFKEDPVVMEEAFASVARELRAGEIVCIFPEGSITRDGALGRFRPGIERIIRETPAPVIPMALKGLWHSFFSRNAQAKRKRHFPWLLWMPIELAIAPPVLAHDVTAAGLEAETARLLNS